MNKGKKLYEGKAKILYETKEKGLAIQHFKDDATAFNNQKRQMLKEKVFLIIVYQNIFCRIKSSRN